MKFLLDEHLDTAVAESLRHAGVDAVSIQDVGIRSWSDEQILVYAKDNGRVVVTADEDFLILNAENMEHAGIAFLTKRLSVGALKEEIEKVSILFEPEHLKNRVIFIPLK